MTEAQGIGMEAARAARAATIPAGRYGTPEEFGAACAFLCSVHAGFIVGQNILARRRGDQRHALMASPTLRRAGRGCYLAAETRWF